MPGSVMKYRGRLVWSRGARLGRFILTAPEAAPYSPEQLAQAVALVDQAGAALAARPANP